MTENDDSKSPADLRLSLTNLSEKSSPASSTSPRIKIDLGFTDISYTVRTGILKRGRKQLLKNISGNFRPGELTAILGPSGAGKSTLMDVLAGFTTSSVGGQVTVNGRPRDLAVFRRASAYIMQEDNIQPLLTVQEAMTIAAELKLSLPREKKIDKVDKILVALGLDLSRNTLSGKLSGGQRKRLAIALELVNNPPIMFFDEPTSGLDSVTSKQCIDVLKTLAEEGRTIVCTIHQPSALLFDMIDHLYILTEGSCVYTGGTYNLVPYLATIGLFCPQYHNPADFVLEVTAGDYGDFVSSLVDVIKNGKNYTWRSPASSKISKSEKMIALSPTAPSQPINRTLALRVCEDQLEKNHHQATEEYVTSFWKQLCVLLKRNALRLSRDKVLTFTRLTMHFLIAVLAGTLYFQIGQDSAHAFDNVNLLFFSLMFLMFSAFSSTIVTFPLELPVVMREHFNRWYKLRSFYLANKLADFPVQFGAALTFTFIIYVMSGQLLEYQRFFLYVAMCTIVSLVAQTIGLIVGIGLDIHNGVIFGPLFIMPFTIFSGFFVHLSDAHPYLQWIFRISFLKYGFEGLLVAIYGYNRPKMGCSKDFCYYRQPLHVLEQIDMKNAEYWSSISILIGLYFVLEITAYMALRMRLKHRW